MGQFLFDGEMLAEVEQREQDSSQRALVSQIARGLAFSGRGTRVSTRSASGSSHHSREAPQTFPSSVPPLPAPRPSCPKGSPRQMTSGWAPEGPASALEVVVGLYPSAVTQVVGTSLPSFFESEGISSQAPPRHGILGGAWFLPERHVALGLAVADMVEKGAVEPVQDCRAGFYARVFLVPKVTGGWRPIFALSVLNSLLTVTPFRMETVSSVLESMAEGEWMVSLDLKDTYYQGPIHPRSRRFLRFVWQNKVYQFRALCFGLASAPQVFTKVMASLSAWAHRCGIPLRRYLDDWLVSALSKAVCIKNTRALLLLCSQLGIQINWDKSDLVPSQRKLFLGMVLDSQKALVFPSPDSVSRLQGVAKRFLSHLGAYLASGVWTPEERGLHINHLELLAVFRALQTFHQHLLGSVVPIMSDNSTGVAYLRHSGGTHSESLSGLAGEVLRWCESLSISLRPMFIPGRHNSIADVLSRECVGSEWTLHPEVCRALFQLWGFPQGIFSPRR